MSKQKIKKTTLKKKKHNKWITSLYISAILTLTIIIFSNSIDNNFLYNWDDQAQVINNNDIKHLSVQSIKTIFVSYYVGMYQPLTTLTYTIEHSLYGLNPSHFHITNLIIHLLNIILVFVFIQLLTGKIQISIISALFFAIHPMCVESVAWISARSNLLNTFFLLGTLISYMYYLKNNYNFKYFILSIILFTLSLFSKSTAVTLPVLLILMDYYLLKEFNIKSILKKIPFFILSIIFGIIAISFKNTTTDGDVDMSNPFSFFDRIFFMSKALLFYIYKLIIPFNLSAVHYYPEKTNGMLPLIFYVAPVIILLIIWSIYKTSKYRKELIFGILFFLITISLVLLVPQRRTIVAERYTYLPYIGLFFIVGQFYSQIKKFKPYLIILLITFTLLFSLTTYNRNKVWENDITLFTDVIKKYPTNFHGYAVRAHSRLNVKDYKGALTDFDKSLELNPYHHDNYVSRAAVKTDNFQDYEGAIYDYNNAIKINPNSSKAYNGRGTCKRNLKDYEGAMTDYNKAIELDSSYSSAYHNLGVVYADIKNFTEAIKCYDKAIQLNPGYANSYNGRGAAKDFIKDIKGATKDFTKAIELDPNNPTPYMNLGISEFKLNHFELACNNWQKAYQLGYVQAQRMIQQYCK